LLLTSAHWWALTASTDNIWLQMPHWSVISSIVISQDAIFVSNWIMLDLRFAWFKVHDFDINYKTRNRNPDSETRFRFRIRKCTSEQPAMRGSLKIQNQKPYFGEGQTIQWPKHKKNGRRTQNYLQNTKQRKIQ
jgi:hypothetical protein